MSENTILNGDCLTLPPTLSANSAAMVLTDPPYLARCHDRSGRTVPNDDNDPWLVPAFSELYRVLANAIWTDPRIKRCCAVFAAYARMTSGRRPWDRLRRLAPCPNRRLSAFDGRIRL